MGPEELGRLMLEALCGMVFEEVLAMHKHHLHRGAKYIHRSVLKWADETPAESIDDMGD